MLQNLVQESLNTTLSSEIFRFVFKQAFSPVIHAWKEQILFNLSMSDMDRKGLIIAYTTLYDGFVSIYRSAKIDFPEWLLKEFDKDSL